MRRVPKLYIDIETFAGDRPPIESIKAPSNYKDEAKIEAYKYENADKVWRQQALNPLTGVVICVGYAINDNPPECVYGEEHQIIKDIEAVLGDQSMASVVHWVTYNGTAFDIPWLYLRSIKYNAVLLRQSLPQGKNSNDHTDVMRAYAPTLYGKDSYMSMKEISAFMGIKGKSDMDGSMVHDLYLKKEFTKIYDYCKEDVNTTRELYKRLTNNV